MCTLETVARARPNPQVDQEYSPDVWGEATPELKIKTVVKTTPRTDKDHVRRLLDGNFVPMNRNLFKPKKGTKS
jgi:hypothetical protein